MWDLALTVLDLVLEDILFSVYSRDGLHGPGFCCFRSIYDDLCLGLCEDGVYRMYRPVAIK